jgi:hypothetical protein
VLDGPATPDPDAADPAGAAGSAGSGGTTGADGSSRPGSVESELARLTRESLRRSEELREIASRLPAAVSRRSVLGQMVSGIVHAPDRPRVARRVVGKVVRTPVDLGRAAYVRLIGR